MSTDRPLAVVHEVSGVHRLEPLDEVLRERPSLRVIELAGRTPPAPGIGDVTPTELSAPELYLNRELTYLNFCWRVLQEGDDERIPLLERLKFVSIVSSNIDEFFQKRIGGLKQQVGAQLHAISPDGRTPQQQISDCLDVITALEKRKIHILEKGIADLKALGVWIAPYKELDAQQQAYITMQAATTQGVATLYGIDTASTGVATAHIYE